MRLIHKHNIKTKKHTVKHANRYIDINKWVSNTSNSFQYILRHTVGKYSFWHKFPTCHCPKKYFWAFNLPQANKRRWYSLVHVTLQDTGLTLKSNKKVLSPSCCVEDKIAPNCNHEAWGSVSAHLGEHQLTESEEELLSLSHSFILH